MCMVGIAESLLLYAGFLCVCTACVLLDMQSGCSDAVVQYIKPLDLQLYISNDD